jgi:hypothetical protein
VDTGLSETDSIVSDDYYVLYIFGALGWRVGGIIILPIVLSIIHNRFYIGRTATPSLSHTIFAATLVSVALITLLSTAAWFLYVVAWVTRFTDPLYSSGLTVKSIDFDMAYDALYIVVTITAFPPAVILVFRGLSTVRPLPDPSSFATKRSSQC